jgi:DNA-binding NarL/FixJ family response regulator
MSSFAVSAPLEQAYAEQASALPKLLMADDHHLILDALGAIMKREFDVQAVDTSQAFMSALDQFKPDIAVLDVGLPGVDGFSTARMVLERYPNLPIVFLSMYAEPAYAEQAARIGAKAYLSKRVPVQELLSVLHTVLEGGSLPAQKLSASAGLDPDRQRTGLTARQREVLELIATGCSAKDIATKLNISVRTAEFHRATIMQRLGLYSTAQMTRYAIANNLVCANVSGSTRNCIAD